MNGIIFSFALLSCFLFPSLPFFFSLVGPLIFFFQGNSDPCIIKIFLSLCSELQVGTFKRFTISLYFELSEEKIPWAISDFYSKLLRYF